MLWFNRVSVLIEWTVNFVTAPSLFVKHSIVSPFAATKMEVVLCRAPKFFLHFLPPRLVRSPGYHLSLNEKGRDSQCTNMTYAHRNA